MVALTVLALLVGLGPATPGTGATPAQDPGASEPVVGEQLAILRDGEHVEVRQGDWLLLRYRYAGASHKSYVEELLSPAGTNVLRDAPSDHLHHHGLMLAWSVNGTNFWEVRENSGRELLLGLGE